MKEAQQGVQVAQSQLEQERAHMAEVRARVDAASSGPEQVAAKQAQAESSVGQVEQKQAALEQAQIDLGYTTIRAPVTGLVSERSMEPGQTVSHGQALMAIVPLEDVWVTANFKESQLAHMRPGQPVEIEVDAYGEKVSRPRGQHRRGHRRAIQPAAAGECDGQLREGGAACAGQDRVRQGPGSGPLLRPGMSVTPTVLTK